MQKLSASSFLFLLTLCYALVYILSTYSLCCSFMPHFPLSLSLSLPHSFFASLLPFYFLFINSLLCFLYYSSVPHFSLLSPQGLCCGRSSTVITAVLSTLKLWGFSLPESFEFLQNVQYLLKCIKKQSKSRKSSYSAKWSGIGCLMYLALCICRCTYINLMTYNSRWTTRLMQARHHYRFREHEAQICLNSNWYS